MASEVTRRGRIEIDAKVKGQAEIQRIGDGVERMDKKLGSAGKTMVVAQLATKALSAGFNALRGAIGSTITNALNFEDWVGRNNTAVDGMSEAIGGMIDKLTLARTATKLTTGDFKASQGQLEALTKAAIEHARVNKGDFAQSLRAVTDAVVGGRTKALKDLGINVDLIGTAAQKSQKVLDILSDRFGDVTIKATNTNEQIAIMKSRFTDATAEMGAAVLQTDLFKDAIGNLVFGFQELSGWLNRDKSLAGVTQQISQAHQRMNALRADQKRWISFLSETQIEKLLAKERRELERLESLRRGFVSQAATREAREGLSRVMQTLAASESEARMLIERARGGGGRGGRGGGRGGGLRTFLAKAPAEMIGELPMAEGATDVRAGESAANAAALAGEKSIDQQIRGAEAREQVARAMENQNRAAMALSETMGQQRAIMDQTDAALTNMAVGGLANMAGGMWQAIDAALAGEQSIGKAMLSIVKQTLFGIAQQATVQAVFETAKGFAALAIGSPTAAKHFTAAGMFGTAAAMAGIAGIAVSAASRGAGGGAGGGARAAGGGAAAPATRPTVGRDREQESKAFAPVINVYLDADNPASAVHWRKQLKAELKRAET